MVTPCKLRFVVSKLQEDTISGIAQNEADFLILEYENSNDASASNKLR